MHGIALQWYHFNANEADSQLREKERQTLVDIGNVVGDPMMIYEMLRPSQLHEAVFDEHNARLKNEMTDALRQVFEPQARVVALSYVKTPGEIR